MPDTAVGNGPKAAPADAAIAVVTPDAAAMIAAPRVAMPEGPQKWKTIPKEQNGFYAVLDGLCSELSADRVGNDVVVHYGGSSGMYSTQRTGNTSFVALRDSGLESIGDPNIAYPTGLAGKSVDDFWIADSTGTRSSEGAVLHRYFQGKWKTYEKDQTNLHTWLDGGIIGTMNPMAGDAHLWVEGSSTKPPLAFYADIQFPMLSAFPSGDVLIAGTKIEDQLGPIIVRHWSPTQNTKELKLDAVLPPRDGGSSWATLHEIAPDEIYIVRDNRIARWDGEKIRALGRPLGDENITSVHRIASDDLWVFTGDASSQEPTKLQHVTKDAATIIPTPESVVAVDGAARGAAWIVGSSGKIYKRDGETWKPMPLPVPVFSAQKSLKAKAILVMSPDDVTVTAKYWEKGPGWTEQELHTALFRTKPVKETLRCNEPDPENNNVALGRGYQSWPPMADAECKTPFVVLARRSNAHKVTDDWPRLQAAIKGHAELGELSLIELKSGDRTFVGTKVKDLDTGKKLVALAAGKDRLRPEIVCGDPDPLRTIPPK